MTCVPWPVVVILVIVMTVAFVAVWHDTVVPLRSGHIRDREMIALMSKWRLHVDHSPDTKLFHINPDDQDKYRDYLMGRYDRVPYAGKNGGLLFRGVELVEDESVPEGEIRCQFQKERFDDRSGFRQSSR